MRRKIKAIDAKTGKATSVDADEIKQGKIRQSSLPDPLLKRIRFIHAQIKDVYSTTLEEFEIGFMRDADPEGEVALWERIVDALDQVNSKSPTLDRRTVFRTLLAYSMDALTPAELVTPTVQRIIQIAEGE